jgi:AcrR family transcriptional regulator
LGTIYLYFPSKEDVFAALNQKLNQLIGHALTDVPPVTSLEQAVRVRVGQVFEACAANRDLVRLVVLNTDPDSAATRRMRDADENAPSMARDHRCHGDGWCEGRRHHRETHRRAGLVTVYQAFVLNDGRDWEQ